MIREFEAVVIGGGPAGLTAALYLARSGVHTALAEKTAAGGQMLNTSEIENYPGFPKGIKGWELADYMSAHLDGHTVARIRGNVSGLEFSPEPGGAHQVFFAEDAEPLAGKAVIISAGAHHRRLNVPGEARLAGKGVSYCAVCDGNFFRNQPVAVVGGGDSALEESLYLSRIAAKIYLIHRRDSFRGCRHLQNKVRGMPDKIELVLNAVVDELTGGNELETVVVHDVRSGASRAIPIAGLFVYVGMDAGSSFVPGSINMDPQGFIHTDAEMNTSVPGVFAAGDIRAKHLRQISTAVGDGATAATAAISYLEQLNA